MEDNLLLQAIERYLDGTMLPAEKAYFEELRKNTPEIDQMVVEHSMFLHQMDLYSSRLDFKHTLHNIHSKLTDQGDINEGRELDTKGKVIRIWNKYRKVTAIAACVGGAIALVISGLVSYISPVNNSKLEQLKGEIETVKIKVDIQKDKLNDVESKLPKDVRFTASGSGFLIDGKGYIVTNAHVIKGSSFASVYNKNGEFNAAIIYRDDKRDIAILKIKDKDFEPVKTLPYSLKKSGADLGEEIFTLGYPKNDIVYNVGVLSSKTGLNGDSTNFQIQMSANPGNSGGPVLNKNGEIIGILSSREKSAEGVTFAVKSKNIYKLLDELKEKQDTTVQKIKIPASTSLKGMDRVSQIKEIEDCIFLVRAYNR
jgi:S1-C subfamily serine protease